MENIKHCAVLVRRPEDVWEGTRTALGLAAHNYWAYIFVLDVAVEITDELRENLEWLEEMECPTYSNVVDNEPYGFQIHHPRDLARELKKMDLIIPFGDRSRAAA
jgi:hypothetical protein